MPRLTDAEKEELKKLGIDLDEEVESKASAEEQEPEDSEGEGEEEGSDDEANEKEEQKKPEGQEGPQAKKEESAGNSAPNDEMFSYLRRLEERLDQNERREREREERSREQNAGSREQKPVSDEQKAGSREPQYILTDLHLDEVGTRIKKLEEREGLLLSMAQRQETNLAQGAYAQMRAKYPDFDEFVKPEFRAQALHAVLNDKEGKFGFGQDWSELYEKTYKQLAFDKHKARGDELERKRAERKEKEKRPVGKVLPSGSSFQAPVAKTGSDGPLSGYRGLRDDALRILGGE